jgi:hypothetical protein
VITLQGRRPESLSTAKNQPESQKKSRLESRPGYR